MIASGVSLVRLLVCIFLLSISIGFSPTAAAAIPSAYSIIELSPITDHDELTVVTDLNEAGVAIGWSGNSFGAQTVTWTFGDPTAVPIVSQAGGRALNLQGNVAGDLATGGGGAHAFFWNGATLQDIHSLGGKSLGIDINNANDVVGLYEISPGRPVAYRWKDGVMTSLGTLGGPESTAFSVNQVGQVVGSAETSNMNDRAFIWTDFDGDNISDLGEMKQLPDMGLSSAANGVNDLGVAAGFVLNSQFQRRAAIWNDTTAFVPLGLLAGSVESEAFDINNLGQVVGRSGTPFIWQAGEMKSLRSLIPQDLGWTLLSAIAINDDGLIVGEGLQNGKQRSYVLVPVPEPNSFLLLMLAFGLSIGFPRSSRSLTSAK
jgi:probable HAF family extracellular repeat protein